MDKEKSSGISGAQTAIGRLYTTNLAFAVLLQFIAPSVILVCTVSSYPQDQIIPKHVVNIYWWALAGWLVGISVVIWHNSSNGNWIALALQFAAALIFVCLRALEARPNLPQGWGLVGWLVKNAGWSFLATFTVATTSLALVIGLQIAGHVPDIEGRQTLIAIGACVAISAVSLLPGLMYLGIRTSSTSAYR